MPSTDTNLQQLVINVGTTAQIEAAIAGGQITENMLSVTTDGPDYLQGVQVNGTDLTPDANNKVNIPAATNSVIGVCRGGTPYGTTASSGVMTIVAATEAGVREKTQQYQPIVPARLDLAVREGLGNNSLTWSEAYKTSARNTIGAEAKAVIETLDATDSITLADNTIYNGSTQTALTIALWAAPNVASLAEVVFTSGSTATTLSYPNTIKWLGDDITGGLFIPAVSKRYTIMFYYDGVETVGVVKGVE